jgi:hypothetical protein
MAIGGLLLLGMVFLVGGRNMIDRGRGGEMSRQGGYSIVLGFISVVLAVSMAVALVTGWQIKRSIIAACILLLSSAVAGVPGGKALLRRWRKQTTLVERLTDASTQGKSFLWNRFLTQITPEDFEKFALWLFTQDGYQVTHTGGTDDHGVDLALERDGMTHIAQCKRYTNKPVGSPELRDFYGALVDAGADFGYFLTTSRFTDAARNFAQNKPLELLDKEALYRYAQKWLKMAKETLICSYCDTENRPGASFCRSCGAPVKK